MCDLQEQVQELIDALVQSGSEDGLQVAVYRRGELLVDAVAGHAFPLHTASLDTAGLDTAGLDTAGLETAGLDTAGLDTERPEPDRPAQRPVTSDTLFWSASTGKAVTSTLLHVLVEQGVLDYDTPIASWWPEFGAHGKGGATLRHLLTHSAGVPAVPAETTIEQLADWQHMAAVIADTKPWWVPGERVGYHAVTYGFIAGEIVRRATGQPLSQVLLDRVTGPLGIADELYFSVPETELTRIAGQVDDPAGAAVFGTLPADWPLFQTAPRALFPTADYANRRDLLTADIPYSATGSARAFARMYAALLDSVDGVRLVSRERLQQLSKLCTTGPDLMTGGPSSWALGYSAGLPWQAAPQDHPATFGMVGVGGSAAFANKTTGISIAVTKNRFNPISINAVERVNELVSSAS